MPISNFPLISGHTGQFHELGLVSGISSSSGGGKDVIGKVLLADSSQSHSYHHQASKAKRPEAFPHRVLKFRDLPPWRSQKTFHHKRAGKIELETFFSQKEVQFVQLNFDYKSECCTP